MCECVAFSTSHCRRCFRVKIKFCGEGDSQKCGLKIAPSIQGFVKGVIECPGVPFLGHDGPLLCLGFLGDSEPIGSDVGEGKGVRPT
jgi:hypothetical protein